LKFLLHLKLCIELSDSLENVVGDNFDVLAPELSVESLGIWSKLL
jgi:hypothetical protein